MGQVRRVRRLSPLPYGPPAPPVSYKVPLVGEKVVAEEHLYCKVYPAPFVYKSQVNLM